MIYELGTPIVQVEAARMYRRVGNYVELADLESEGMLMLAELHAKGKVDWTKKPGQIKHYLRLRVRGQMIEYLRYRTSDVHIPREKMGELSGERVGIKEAAELNRFEDRALPEKRQARVDEQFVWSMIPYLAPRLARVVIEYYIDHKPVSEIGAGLGVTDSRISQLLTQARDEIKTMMRKELRCDDSSGRQSGEQGTCALSERPGRNGSS